MPSKDKLMSLRKLMPIKDKFMPLRELMPVKDKLIKDAQQHTEELFGTKVKSQNSFLFRYF